MKTDNISIPVQGSSMPCYVARPDTGGPVGAVIDFQEIFGVNAEVKRITELVAQAGYVGIAPNYYHRTHPTLNAPYTDEGMQEGFGAAATIGRESLKADIDATMAWLANQDFVDSGKIATWGFCIGGSIAFLSGTMPGIAGAICFYGGQIAGPMVNGEPPMIEDVAQIKAPLLLAFGEQDDFIPPEAVEAIKSALDGAGKEYECVSYPDVGHAFFRDSSAAMDSATVKDAWDRAQAFLSRTIG